MGACWGTVAVAAGFNSSAGLETGFSSVLWEKASAASANTIGRRPTIGFRFAVILAHLGLDRVSTLYSPRPAALHQRFNLVHAEAVEIARNGVFQARRRYRELQRFLMIRQRLQAVNQPPREAVSSAHPIHDVRDVVMPAGEKLFTVRQAGRPAVVRRAVRFAQGDRDHP